MTGKIALALVLVLSVAAALGPAPGRSEGQGLSPRLTLPSHAQDVITAVQGRGIDSAMEASQGDAVLLAEAPGASLHDRRHPEPA